MHMGVEPNALFVAVGDHVDAVAGRGQAPDNGGNWLFGDIHWRHPVSATPYNLFQRIAGFDPTEAAGSDRKRAGTRP